MKEEDFALRASNLASVDILQAFIVNFNIFVIISPYISDIFGVSGRYILECLLNGEVITAEIITKMVKSKIKSKIPGLGTEQRVIRKLQLKGYQVPRVS